MTRGCLPLTFRTAHPVLRLLHRLRAAHTNVMLQTLHSLQPVFESILQQQPLKVHVKGLEYMNDDPSAMHVAYVGVQDPAGQPGSVEKLQQLCTAVVDAFSNAGLLLSRDDRCWSACSVYSKFCVSKHWSSCVYCLIAHHY